MLMKKMDLPSLLKQKKPIVAPGAYDAFSASLIDKGGFPAVYLTGYGVTASHLGRPDIGFLTLNDMCATVRAITQVIAAPLIADCESGFGNAVNLTRTVREYEMAGAAAIHLEDQLVPKKWSGTSLPQVGPADEHAAKIRLALKCRTSNRFLIIGRTDCIQSLGLKEAIRRGNLYRDAGADIIFVHGIATPKELREVGRGVRGPKLVNYSALTLSGDAAPPTVAELHSWGYSIIIFAIEPLFAAVKGMQAMLSALSAGADAGVLRSCMQPKAEVEKVVNVAGYHKLEEEYLPRMAAPARTRKA
jgi:2-methylisocitrate lyase-like PEP mutase family enzyme